MSNVIECNYAIKMDKNLDDVISLKAPQRIKVKTINAFGGEFETVNDIVDLINNKYSDNKHHHPLTGPINIENAKKGDVLKITINKIKVEKMGQALSQSAGVSPIKTTFFAERAPILSYYNEKTNDINYMNGITIPYKPMIGVIGTAPKDEFIKTGHASRTGGNLDIPFITHNTTLYLPIEVDGAKLYLGDVHGNQGYGELGGVALETSATLDITIEVLKPYNEFNDIMIIGIEPFSGKNALGIVGVANCMGDLNNAIYQSYINSINVLSNVFPTYNKNTISNLITTIGNSFNGQAFSKTSESTSLVVILEDDFKKIFDNANFNIYEIENILFKHI